MANPETMAAAARILIDQKANYRLAELEAWGRSQPYRRTNPQLQAEDVPDPPGPGQRLQPRLGRVEGNDDNL
jgi:hypothetical protein